MTDIISMASMQPTLHRYPYAVTVKLRIEALSVLIVLTAGSPACILDPAFICTSLFTKDMVAITTTKNENYKGLQTCKKTITLT